MATETDKSTPHRGMMLWMVVLLFIVFAGIGAAVLSVYLYWSRFSGPLSTDQAVWGQLGDYIGGVLNPTFSFLAFIALAMTVALQIRQIQNSAIESRKTDQALSSQLANLQQQVFEGTFFQMLRLHNDIISALNLPGEDVQGRACFEVIFKDLVYGTGVHRGDIANFSDFDTQYEMFYQKHEPVLAHYFRLLYTLIKLVKASQIQNKRFYTNIVRAQLSSHELELLFFNCLSSYGRDKFKPMVEEFAMLKTFRGMSEPPSFLVASYSLSAFGGEYKPVEYY